MLADRGMGIGHFRLQLDCFFIPGQGFLESTQRMKIIRDVCRDVGRERIQLDRSHVQRQRLLNPTQLLTQQESIPAIGLRIVGIQFDGA